MRLGSMLTTQAFGAFYYQNSAGLLAICAVGAAYEAIGHLKDPNPTEFSEFKLYVGCPVPDCCPTYIGLCSVIVHLNDNINHRWSREQIADWVESVEKAHAQASAVKEAEPEACLTA